MDTAYLEQMNQRLEAYSSFLVLRRGGEVYYSGGPGDTGLELSNLELFTVDSGFVSGEEPYHLKQIDFGFSDGSEGVVQILTPVESVVHQVENMIAGLGLDPEHVKDHTITTGGPHTDFRA